MAVSSLPQSFVGAQFVTVNRCAVQNIFLQ
jgi:hypothetical protein